MNRLFNSVLIMGGLLLASCATAPDEVQPMEPTPWDKDNLSFEPSGFYDKRTDWLFPQVLESTWVASQAWEYEKSVIGIEYVASGELLEIATVPSPVPSTALESGTISILAYPAEYSLNGIDTAYLGSVVDLLGLGYRKSDGIDEFWAYQKSLEESGYNLWKLVKFSKRNEPDRVFHSLLVLKKLSDQVSEGLVVTVGQASDCYVLIVNRRYVRTKDDVDQLGHWALNVLTSLDLVAIKE